jgi:hypothetical protein
MMPVNSAGTSDCLLVKGNTGPGGTALQNGLAFTDSDLRRGYETYTYAKLLVGGTALAANNWGIDGGFETKMYNAPRQFQIDKQIRDSATGKLNADGKFGNDTRSKSWYGHNTLTNGYKYLVQGVMYLGATWHYSRVTGAYAYNCVDNGGLV